MDLDDTETEEVLDMRREEIDVARVGGATLKKGKRLKFCWR